MGDRPVKVVEVGVCGVDTGMIWIGDPSYILHKDKKDLKDFQVEVGKDWDGFCELANKTDGCVQFDFVKGFEGLGVLIKGFGGDGTFPVEVFLDKDGLVTEARIRFR